MSSTSGEIKRDKQTKQRRICKDCKRTTEECSTNCSCCISRPTLDKLDKQLSALSTGLPGCQNTTLPGWRQDPWSWKPRSFVLAAAFFKRNWLKPVAANCLPSKLKVPSMDPPLLLAFRILSVEGGNFTSSLSAFPQLLSAEWRIFFCLGRCGKVNEWQYATNNSGHARCRRCPCRFWSSASWASFEQWNAFSVEGLVVLDTSWN